MLPLRHLLLVAVLFFAQLAAGAHAVEHARNSDDGLPTHVCQLCLAAHDLVGALPSVASLPAVPFVHVRPEAPLASGRDALPAPRARQGAPPLS